MATIADLSVQVGADVSRFTRDMRRLERQFADAGRNMTRSTDSINREFSNMSGQLPPLQRQMRDLGRTGSGSLEEIRRQTDVATAQLEEFRAAIESGGLEADTQYSEARDNLRAVRQELNMLTSATREYGPTLAQAMTEGMRPMIDLQRRQREIRQQFAEMSFNPERFQGDSRLMMAEIERLGAAQRTINDRMMEANRLGIASLMQQAGTLLNMTTMSSRIAANFERMGAPLAPLNNVLLGIGSRLERAAHRGNAVVLALQHLGPNANMRELNNYIRMINTGLMRSQMLVFGFGLLFIGVLVGINKLLEKNGLTKMAHAAEHLGDSLNKFLLPFLRSFDAVAAAIIYGVDAVAKLGAKLAEVNPVLAASIGWFALLFIALMVILAPLAIGIGLAGGMAASFTALWAVISPFVIGFLAVAGTALVIAAALVAVGAAIYLLWTRTTWFKDAVIGVWEAIKTGTATAWNAILDFIQPAIEAIQAFIQEKMTQVQEFWDENGEMIKQAATNIWTFIENKIGTIVMAIIAVFKWAWPYMQVLIVDAWEAIKQTVNGALQIIMGVIKFFAALFAGDWDALWESVKQILKGALELILGIVHLFMNERLLKFLAETAVKLLKAFADMWDKVKAKFDEKLDIIHGVVTTVLSNVVSYVVGLGVEFFNAGKGLIEQMQAGIERAATKVMESVKNIAGKIRDFLPFSPAKVGPLSDLDKLDFGGPISDSIVAAIPRINGLMNDMLTMPGITMEQAGGSDSEAIAGGDTYYLNVQLDPKNLTEMTDIYEFFSTFKQVKRARGF